MMAAACLSLLAIWPAEETSQVAVNLDRGPAQASWFVFLHARERSSLPVDQRRLGVESRLGGPASGGRTWPFTDDERACAWVRDLSDAYRDFVEPRPTAGLDGRGTANHGTSAADACLTLRVNTTEQRGDAHPGDGRCETAPGNGRCSLRAALDEARALAGAKIIDLPSGRYQLGISLPSRGTRRQLDVQQMNEPPVKVFNFRL